MTASAGSPPARQPVARGLAGASSTSAYAQVFFWMCDRVQRKNVLSAIWERALFLCPPKMPGLEYKYFVTGFPFGDPGAVPSAP